MPLLPEITIHPADLQEILNQLAAKHHTGPVIIIDCKWSCTIRDTNNSFITEVKKSQLEEVDG